MCRRRVRKPIHVVSIHTQQRAQHSGEWDMMMTGQCACVQFEHVCVIVLTPDTAASIERVSDGIINSNDSYQCKWSIFDKRARTSRTERDPPYCSKRVTSGRRRFGCAHLSKITGAQIERQAISLCRRQTRAASVCHSQSNSHPRQRLPSS